MSGRSSITRLSGRLSRPLYTPRRACRHARLATGAPTEGGPDDSPRAHDRGPHPLQPGGVVFQ
jgi:hypothetical protein